MNIKQLIFDGVKLLESLKIHGSEARLLVQVAELLKQAFEGAEEKEKECTSLKCEIDELKAKVQLLEKQTGQTAEVLEITE
jgi:hypothetical protein